MKIAILGATGWIGSNITAEAKKRGHDVVAIVRNKDKVTTEDITIRIFDLRNDNNINDVLVDVDVVIASVGGRAVGNHDLVAKTAKRLLEALNNSGKRLLWVGGAGSLEIAPGVANLTSPNFPAEYKDEAIAQSEALDVFRNSSSSVDWTYISPAALLYPGDSEGIYRIGGDELLTNSQGESKISDTDYAIAVLDEVEKSAHLNQRIGVAY